jgi:hypothetical protein
MNYDMRFSSSPWIKIIADKNTNTHKENDDLYKLYPTNNCSISAGREYIALPFDKILSPSDLLKYNIDK